MRRGEDMHNFDDSDMKIVGDRPSETVRQMRAQALQEQEAVAREEAGRAKQLGEEMAKRLLLDDGEISYALSKGEALAQRRSLLSFTITVGFARFCQDRRNANTAYGAFCDALQRENPEVYREMSNAGVFSFYYLAYRRGGDVERRMGQTYAMLCAKDGDPVVQELGEALYCRFSAMVQEAVERLGL